MKILIEKYLEYDPISRVVIAFSLFLVFFAYLPTLQFDYVTQDQWRAFRYSLEAQSLIDRASSCTKMIPRFYIQTGRPLVWITECLEHAAVANVYDFSLLRPIVLGVALVTTIYLGVVLSSLTSSMSSAMIAAASLMMVPAYSFMLLQGATAFMVLLSIIFAVASYNKLTQCIESYKSEKYFWALFYFLLACFIYPAFAFIVISIALVELGFSDKNIKIRIIVFSKMLGFYFFSSIVYYSAVKVGNFVLAKIYGELPSLGGYDVSVQLTPISILTKLGEAATYFYSMPAFNFSGIKGLPIIITLAFCAYASKSRHAKKDMYPSFISYISRFLIVFIVVVLALVASISPWLFSKMDNMATRHLMPWYLFFCVATTGLLSIGMCRLLKQHSKWTNLLVMSIFLMPIAFVQNRLSTFEVIVTGTEISMMRSKLNTWIQQKGWTDNRYLLIIRPTVSRPIGIDHYLDNSEYGNDNAVLASSRNPVSIPWMFNAFLREHSYDFEFKLVDCAFDSVCVGNALQDPKNVVIGYTNGDLQIISPIQPYIINLSELTSQPVYPRIQIKESPTITASSSAEGLGVYGLLSSKQPGWHAERNPSYPQLITIDFREVKSINRIGLLPQDGYISRMPRNIKIMTSFNGQDWLEAELIENICDNQDTEGWHIKKFNNHLMTRYMKLEILSNCGSPDFLTLRGLKVE